MQRTPTPAPLSEQPAARTLRPDDKCAQCGQPRSVHGHENYEDFGCFSFAVIEQPAAPDVKALVEEARDFTRAGVHLPPDKARDLAAALDAAQARIAELERINADQCKGYARMVTQADDTERSLAFMERRAESAEARAERLRNEMERIADLTERWTDSLVSQVNEIARAALSTKGEDGR